MTSFQHQGKGLRLTLRGGQGEDPLPVVTRTSTSSLVDTAFSSCLHHPRGVVGKDFDFLKAPVVSAKAKAKAAAAKAKAAAAKAKALVKTTALRLAETTDALKVEKEKFRKWRHTHKDHELSTAYQAASSSSNPAAKKKDLNAVLARFAEMPKRGSETVQVEGPKTYQDHQGDQNTCIFPKNKLAPNGL
jgi:hypothetical protein